VFEESGGLAVAFDLAGVPAVREQAVMCLAPQGKLVLVGLADQPLTITGGTRFSYLQQQQVLGHYGSLAVHIDELVALIRRRRLDFSRSVSAVLPLASAADAVDRLTHMKGNPIRLILRP
jgi:threonine dehydrogenase-like Zn-dependent dehydrogenase